MADEDLQQEATNILESLDPIIKTAENQVAVDINEFNATKARVLIQKLQSHIDKLNALRPKKTQATGLSSYSSIVHPVVLILMESSVSSGCAFKRGLNFLSFRAS